MAPLPVAISNHRQKISPLGATKPKIIDLPNGVDIEAFSNPAARPETLEAAIQSGKYFLFIGRLAPRKGVDIFYSRLCPVAKIFNGSPGHRR